MNRRSFLKTSLAAATAAVSPTFAASPTAGALPTRRLGDGLEVSALGLGCMGLRYAFRPQPSADEGIRLIREAHDRGVTFFDTAECYGPLTDEALVGEALRPIRDRVVLATKGGVKEWDGRQVLDNRPSELRRCLEGSLRRLKTDHIDLWYLHRYDPAVPIEEIAATVAQLRQEGKILHWGLSEAGVKTLRKAHAISPLAAVQNEYAVWMREPEPLLPVLEELGIGLVCFSPLGKGYLTGRFDGTTRFLPGDMRPIWPRFSAENMAANRRLIDFLRSWAEPRGLTVGQLSLAWLLVRKPWVVPIPGTTDPAHLRENLAAVSAATALSPEAWAAFDAALAQIPVSGDRYPPEMRARVGR